MLRRKGNVLCSKVANICTCGINSALYLLIYSTVTLRNIFIQLRKNENIHTKYFLLNISLNLLYHLIF